MRIQGKVLAAMEALLRDLLYCDALVKLMAKCLMTLDLSAVDTKSIMGREGVARLGLDKTKLDVKAAPSGRRSLSTPFGPCSPLCSG
jgi:hypothetical protein